MPNKKIKFAMCGCGHIAPRWFDVFEENQEIELTCVIDPDPNSFDKLLTYSFSNILKFSTIEEAYNKCEFDAVIILTPPQYHARYIQSAINKGKHVLTEKPLCTNLDQFKHIKYINLKANKMGLITAVNQQYRWNPRIQVIHEAVQNNQIGNIYLVNSIFNQNNYHFKKWWRQQHGYISLVNWYVHIIDTMRFYLNQNPISVSANFIRPPHSKIVGYSSLIMDVEFEKGTIWHLTANQENIAGPTTSGHSDFLMHGTKGTIENTKNNPPFLYNQEGKKIELGKNIADIDNATTYPPGWKDTVKKFVHSIKTGEEHPTSIEDNLWTMTILLAAIKSFETKKRVLISDIMDY